MANASIRIKKRKKALETINELNNAASNLLITHYSCESFYDIKDGRTPRVTSIAVRYYRTAQTKSFSIHKIAEREGYSLEQIENHYDHLEKEMLHEFFEFVEKHLTFNWLHWNMRDMNYGFEAIENRYIVLKGKPVSINDNNKFDLSRLLVDIYGKYIDHPRFEKLMEKNNITKKDFLTGKEEAFYFEKKEFVKLHQSTLRKVDILHTIFERTLEGTLKTNASLRQIYGLSPQGIFNMFRDNWVLSIVASVGMLVLGGVIGAVISKYFIN